MATSPAAPSSEGAEPGLRLAAGKAFGLLALIGVGLVVGTHQRGALALKQFLCWGAAGLTIAVLLTYRTPLTALLEATLSAPVAADTEAAPQAGMDAATVSLRARSNGHFVADALVNGTHVSFIVDTGATDVVLRRTDAERLGIDLDALRYEVPVHTANGDTLIALVDLDEIVIGAIRVERVSASVPQNELSHSLLGMSFLKRLSSFSVDSDRLVMRQ
jgi:aspartyl protease family protein